MAGCDSRRPRITRSATECLNRGGAGGCIATAGASRAARSAARAAPAVVVSSAASADSA